jgi:hypothetical protein
MSGSDILRHEIRTTLARGVLLVPVLFDGVEPPRRATLPPDIAGLADRQAIRVDADHFDADLRRVEREVRRVLDGS